jgi:hypothetical protein
VKGRRARGCGSRSSDCLRASVRMWGDWGMERDICFYIHIYVGFVFLGLGLTFVDGPLSTSQLFRLTKVENQIDLTNFGSQEIGTELITEFFGSGSFGFGSGYFGSVFCSRLNLPRVTRHRRFLVRKHRYRTTTMNKYFDN